MAKDRLTPKQERYVQGLFAGLSQREAYRQAYSHNKMTDKQVDEEACKLAAHPKIVQRLDELQGIMASKNMATVDRVIAELSRIAFADSADYARVVEREFIEDVKDDDGNVIGQKSHIYKVVEVTPTDALPEDKRAAIAGVKQTKDGIEIKQADKLKALELLGRTLGIYKDKTELSGKVEQGLSDADRALMDKIAKRLDDK
jgi:phage terminase small subunit